MKHAFELLILDWDGTLVDSEATIVASMQAAFAAAEREIPASEAVRQIIGLGMKEAVLALSPGLSNRDVEQVIAHYRTAFFGSAEPPRLFDGAREALARLKADGYRLAVATGKGRPGLDKGMHETGLDDVFEITRCASETRSKPHPEMLEQILAETWVEPQRALMIGDTSFDLEMASGAGCPALAVTSGAHDEDSLKKFKPVACLPSVADLPDWLSQFNQSPLKL